MSIETTSKINQLLRMGTKNGLYFSAWLKQNGYSDQLISRYRQSGWLSSLAKGVVYRTGDRLSAYAALSCYNSQLNKNVRVAAHSALEIFGFNHYVPMGKPVLMAAYSESTIPKWMTADTFDRTIKPFETNMFARVFASEILIDDVNLLVAAPEQAFMECLLLAPSQYNYLDLFYIMEQLTSLRADVVQTLLETMKSIRVKRMFLYMAEKSGHYWHETLNLSKIDLGTAKLQLTDNGVYISKYRITVPKELNDYV